MSTAHPADTAPRTGAMTSAPEPGAALPIEFEAFLTHLAVERGRSARTLSAYRRDLARLVAFCSRNGIDPLTVRAVTHIDVGREDCVKAIAAVHAVATGVQRPAVLDES